MFSSLNINLLHTLFVVLFTTLTITLTYSQSNNYLESNTSNINNNKRILKFTDSITKQAIEQRHYKSGQINDRKTIAQGKKP